MNLIPEQLELLYCLLGALAIGYLFGYFYKRAVANKRYTAEIKELGDMLDKRDIEIETASAKHGQLKQHMAVQASELKSLNQQVVDLQGNVSAFESQAGLLHKEKSELEELLHSKINHLDEAQVRLQKLHEDKESAQSELLKTQETLHEYKNASNSQNEKLAFMQKELEAKQTLEQKVEALQANIQEKEHFINDLKSKTLKLDEVYKENEHLRVKAENLSKELEHSKHELKNNVTKTAPVDEEMQLKYKSLEKELELKTSTIANLKKNNEALEQKVKTAVAAPLVGEVNSEELTGLKHKLVEKDTLLKQSREKLEHAEAQLANLKNNTVDTSKIEKELQMAKIELSNKEKMLVATQDKLRTTQAKVREIESKLQTTVVTPQNASYLSERDDAKKGWFSGFFTKDSINKDGKPKK
jgi:chromosome segregation ATPase